MANTSRMNRLEELGRVDAEKAYTGKGKRNLRDEKKRIVRELKADGGYITKKKKPSWITKKKKDPSTKPMDPKQKSPKNTLLKDLELIFKTKQDNEVLEDIEMVVQ